MLVRIGKATAAANVQQVDESLLTAGLASAQNRYRTHRVGLILTSTREVVAITLSLS